MKKFNLKSFENIFHKTNAKKKANLETTSDTNWIGQGSTEKMY